MISFRNNLLDQFGIEDEYTAIVSPEIRLQRRSEREPFAEIVTAQGRTVLRVGKDLHTSGPVLKIR